MDIYERLMQRQKENQPFLDFIGAVSEEVGPGRAVITLKPRPEHMNYRGIVHGGCLFTLPVSAVTYPSKPGQKSASIRGQPQNTP